MTSTRSSLFGGWRSAEGSLPTGHAKVADCSGREDSYLSEAALTDHLELLTLGAPTATVTISAQRKSPAAGKPSPLPQAQPQPICSAPGRRTRRSPNCVLLGSDSGSECTTPASSPRSDSLRALSLPHQQQQQQPTPSSPPPQPPRATAATPVGRTARQASGGVKEVTVDSLVKAVSRARAGQPVIEAVRDGLYCLDGRAVAALLKELAKNGLQYAASDLFDWLRALPPSHQLSRLVDVYTYTTIISQCGNHQQLRKALELVAEMRGKGIACNIHTFSALMSVCVKCNEWELALDVYGQLQAEGCTPNMVTFNILIDIHSKAGQWDQAVAVLDEIRGQGLALEARTYNTVITACSKTGQPQQALKVYQRMLSDGVAPTGTTYTSLISAYGKAGQVEEALQVYEDMRTRGCECNVITYSSLISACERAGRWEVALQLFDRMLREECRPNVVTYNALIGACGNGGALDKATEVFDHMVSHGCRPDAVTFSVLIAAYERGGQWGQALQTLERMQQHGFRPDACVYNCVLDALWATGLAAAKVKAVQLFQYACRQGHLRIHANSSREFTAVAHTYCACLLVLLKWLADCRDLLVQLARPGAAGTPALSLHLIKGKHSRPDQSYRPIQVALQRMANAFSAPLSIRCNEQGLVVQAEGLSLAAWLASDAGSTLLQPLCNPMAMPLPSGSLVQNDLVAEQQCIKAFAAVKEFESGSLAHLQPGSGGQLPCSRGSLWQTMVDLTVSLASSLQVSEETTHDTLLLVDRLLGSGAVVEQGNVTAVTMALLLLKCKQGGEVRPLVADGALLFRILGLPAEALAASEDRILRALHGDLTSVSALRVLQLYLERLGCSPEALMGSRVLQLTVMSALDMTTKAALTPAFYQFLPSVVAAACLCRAREGLGLVPTWPSALHAMTGYAQGASGDAVRECQELLDMLGLVAN